MSLYDYEISKKLCELDPPFAALIMVAARKADTSNYAILSRAFPEIVGELALRYWSPGGLLEGEVIKCSE